MYRRKAQGWIKHWDFILLDLFVLHLSFLGAYLLRLSFENPLNNKQIYTTTIMVMTLSELVVILVFNTMKNVLKRSNRQELKMTSIHVFLIVAITVFYLVALQKVAYFSRIILFTWAIVYFYASYMTRIIWKRLILTGVFKTERRSLLIITTSDMADKVVDNINKKKYEFFYIAGIAIIDKNMVGRVIDDVHVVASKDNVTDYICREWIDEVFINMKSFNEYPENLIGRITEMGVVVHIKISEYEKNAGEIQLIEKLGNYKVITTTIASASPMKLLIKRVIDIIGGILGCIVTGILFLILAPCIKKASPGPVFFAQERVGKNGRKFKMYKFRSMYMDAEERKKELAKHNQSKDGMTFKMKWDPRIIGSKMVDGKPVKGLGNYMRDWSLDEWPQFFNVLKGDMSLVGTRPPTIDEWKKYKLHHRARLATKPGITGMWQVSGRNKITDFEKIVELDTMYIKNWSLLMDVKILIKTVKVVLKKEGSM